MEWSSRNWCYHRDVERKVSWKEHKLCSTIYINIRYLKTNNRVVSPIQQHKSLLRMFRNNVSSIRFSGSTDEHDNKFVMVIINKYLHALVELHPVKDFKAETIAAKLVEHFRIFSTPQWSERIAEPNIKMTYSKRLRNCRKVSHQLTQIAHLHEQHSKVRWVNNESNKLNESNKIHLIKN
jgi:hypothetical protein